MAWINTIWTTNTHPSPIVSGGGKTMGIIENAVVPTGFIGENATGFKRVVITQTDDTVRTEYPGMTLASAKKLCDVIGDDVQQTNGRITYTRSTSYNRVNPADGFTVTVVEVTSVYTRTETILI